MRLGRILLCLFVLLVVLDLIVGVPVLLEFMNGPPAVSAQYEPVVETATATPTPFQPVTDTPLPTLFPSTPTFTATPEPEPSLPENPYDFGGIRFDASDTISLVFYPRDFGSFPVSFIPAFAEDGPESYRPGIGKAGVFADGAGNVTVNPHSGCFRYSKEYIPIEGEYLRQYLEGGGCYDVLSELNDSQINERIENLLGSDVEMTQNGATVQLTVVSVGVITYDNLDFVKSMNPGELALLTGTELSSRSIVVITSGWDTKHPKIWFSAERWIVVLEEK